jgi:hypothetical protein
LLLVVIAEATLLTAAEYYKVTNSPARYVSTQHVDPKRKELRKPTWYSLARTTSDKGVRLSGHAEPTPEIAMPMVQRISIRALAVLALGASGASAGELPQYEVMGFPISPLQMSVLRSGGIQEELPTPEVTLLGIPFSPHQIAVVSARLIARCVCIQSTGDLMLGSHTHD